MDRKTILEKGLLIKYVLGELNEQDQLLVEKVIQEDENLKKQFLQLESDIERMAMENAVTPPASVRTGLEKSLETSGRQTDTPVRKLNNKSAFNPIRLSVAASLAALFALSTFYFYNRWQASEDNIRLVQEEQRQMQDALQRMSEEMNATRELYGKMNDKDAIPLVLEGNQLSPEARAIAYVNHKDRSVLVNPQALPELSDEETYQMWADVDGEMISMGLLPTEQELVALTYIDKAESLNITIEPRGGSEHPTVERLISNVYL
jgi:anti-sigma-K factor RskA